MHNTCALNFNKTQLTEQVINKTAATIFNILMNNINFGNSFSSSTAAAAAIFDCVVLTSLFIEVSIDPATLPVVGAAGAGADTAGVGAGVDEGAGMDVSTSAASVAGLESAPSSHEGVSPSTIFIYLY